MIPGAEILDQAHVQSALALFVLIAGCDPAPSNPIPATPTRVLTQAMDGSKRLSTREIWRVGDGSDRGGLELFRVRGAKRTSDGTTYVLDAGNHRVVILDSLGTVVHSFGSEGEGPGEFTNPSDLVLRRDTIVVRDRGNRVHFFQTDGSVVATRLLAFPDPEVNSLGLVGSTDSSWTVSAVGYFSESSPGTPPVQRQHFFDLDPSTGDLQPTGLRWRHESPGKYEGIFWLQPILQHRPAAALDGLGRFLLSDTLAYRVDIYSLDGAHRLRIENEVERRPISDELIDLWRESRNCPAGLEAALECSNARDRMILGMERPTHRPVVGRIRGYGNGFFSVRRADLDPNPFDAESSSEYDHFDSEGRFLGATSGLIPLDLGTRYLVALQRDELGVESIVLYEIGGSNQHAP